MPAFGQRKFVRIYERQKNLTSVQEILLFWQTKGCGHEINRFKVVIKGNSAKETCCGPYTRDGKLVKENLSMETCQGKLACLYRLQVGNFPVDYMTIFSSGSRDEIFGQLATNQHKLSHFSGESDNWLRPCQ